MKNVFLFFLFILIGVEGWTNDYSKLFIEGRVTNAEGKKLEGVTVTIYSEDRSVVVQQRKTNEAGVYTELELKMGEVYIMEVTKKGFVPKRILIDTKKGFFEEDSPLFVPMDIPFQLDRNKDLKNKKELVRTDYYLGKLMIDPFTGGIAIDTKFSSEQKKIYESHSKK